MTDKREPRKAEPTDAVKEMEVMQHYQITMAKHNLTAIELRIMALVLHELKNEQLNSYSDNVRDTKDLLDEYKQIRIRSANVVVCDNHQQVKRALSSLRKRDIETRGIVNGKKGWWIDGLISRGFYSEDGSDIIIEVSPSLLPRLIEVSNNYTLYALEFLFKTKSAYAIRWYMVACHWLKNGVFTLTKDDIRRLFNLGEKYKTSKDFMRWVIKKPFDEINNKSDLEIAITETHKKGRVTIGYTFSVKAKHHLTVETAVDETANQIYDHVYIQQYISRYNQAIVYYCNKFSIDFKVIYKRLKKRGVSNEYKAYKHFENATNKYICRIITEDGLTSMTEEQLLREYKNY